MEFISLIIKDKIYIKITFRSNHKNNILLGIDKILQILRFGRL